MDRKMPTPEELKRLKKEGREKYVKQREIKLETLDKTGWERWRSSNSIDSTELFEIQRATRRGDRAQEKIFQQRYEERLRERDIDNNIERSPVRRPVQDDVKRTAPPRKKRVAVEPAAVAPVVAEPTVVEPAAVEDGSSVDSAGKYYNHALQPHEVDTQTWRLVKRSPVHPRISEWVRASDEFSEVIRAEGIAEEENLLPTETTTMLVCKCNPEAIPIRDKRTRVYCKDCNSKGFFLVPSNWKNDIGREPWKALFEMDPANKYVDPKEPEYNAGYRNRDDKPNRQEDQYKDNQNPYQYQSNRRDGPSNRQENRSNHVDDKYNEGGYDRRQDNRNGQSRNNRRGDARDNQLNRRDVQQNDQYRNENSSGGLHNGRGNQDGYHGENRNSCQNNDRYRGGEYRDSRENQPTRREQHSSNRFRNNNDARDRRVDYQGENRNPQNNDRYRGEGYNDAQYNQQSRREDHNNSQFRNDHNSGNQNDRDNRYGQSSNDRYSRRDHYDSRDNRPTRREDHNSRQHRNDYNSGGYRDGSDRNGSDQYERRDNQYGRREDNQDGRYRNESPRNNRDGYMRDNRHQNNDRNRDGGYDSQENHPNRREEYSSRQYENDYGWDNQSDYPRDRDNSPARQKEYIRQHLNKYYPNGYRYESDQYGRRDNQYCQQEVCHNNGNHEGCYLDHRDVQEREMAHFDYRDNGNQDRSNFRDNRQQNFRDSDQFNNGYQVLRGDQCRRQDEHRDRQNQNSSNGYQNLPNFLFDLQQNQQAGPVRQFDNEFYDATVNQFWSIINKRDTPDKEKFLKLREVFEQSKVNELVTITLRRYINNDLYLNTNSVDALMNIKKYERVFWQIIQDVRKILWLDNAKKTKITMVAFYLNCLRDIVRIDQLLD